MTNKADLFLSLPADVVSQIEELIDEAAEDGYQNGYAAGVFDTEEKYGLIEDDDDVFSSVKSANDRWIGI